MAENENRWNLERFNDLRGVPWEPSPGKEGPENSMRIKLPEEERDVKQGNVTEEVVLYCFLGVFVIFVVDSFAKVGKYVR